MRPIIKAAVVPLLVLLCSSQSLYADVICLNASLVKGKVRTKALTISSGKCPRNYTQLFNSDSAAVAGPRGLPGVDGADGSIRIYGDGSLGDLTVDSTVFLSTNTLQYNNITVESAGVLRLKSGSVLRLTGNLIIRGKLQVDPPVVGGSYACAAGPCPSGAIPSYLIPAAGPSGESAGPGEMGPLGAVRLGGRAAFGLDSGRARAFLTSRPVGGGSGLSEFAVSGINGQGGGGMVTVLAKGNIMVESGAVVDASASPALFTGMSGGGGGILIFASPKSVTVNGQIAAKGASGTSASAIVGTGGSGGGGLVHIISPSANVNGVIDVSGGAAAPAFPAGTIIGSPCIGGPGGGASFGSGSNGGTINADGSVSATGQGGVGLVIIDQQDPTSLF